MQNVIMEARTVSIVKPYREETRKGNNGDFTAKEIFFKVACDRDYKTTKTENGKTVSEYPSDFFLVKATGELAVIFNKFATAVKEDGKLQSRHIMVQGTFETYRKDREVVYEKDINIGGQVYHIKDTVVVPDTQTILVADKIRFLDSNPQTKANLSSPVVTAQPVVTPVASPAPQVQLQTQAPVVQAQAPVVEVPTADLTQACPY